MAVIKDNGQTERSHEELRPSPLVSATRTWDCRLGIADLLRRAGGPYPLQRRPTGATMGRPLGHGSPPFDRDPPRPSLHIPGTGPAL
jgi:hypothetical protein